LKFKWDEVHDMAEELEHISSTALINRLDEFMGCPQFDPHGDPIPDTNGHIQSQNLQPVLHLNKNQSGTIAGVADHSAAFLQYLEKIQLTIGQTITVTNVTDYDLSVMLNKKNTALNISREVAKNILIMV
jgi:DtxR family Mn-dependent transcriptional regulator